MLPVLLKILQQIRYGLTNKLGIFRYAADEWNGVEETSFLLYCASFSNTVGTNKKKTGIVFSSLIFLVDSGQLGERL